MSDSPHPIGDGRPRPPFEPRVLACPRCAAPLTIRDDRAVQSTCDACGAHLALTPTEARLLSSGKSAKVAFDLEIGHPVVLDGHTYEVSARIAYRYGRSSAHDPLLHVYLLFSPRRSSVYLSQYDGSWEASRPVFVAPISTPSRPRAPLRLHDGRTFIVDEVGERTVVHVDGALPYTVEALDRVSYLMARNARGERYEIETVRGETTYGIGTPIPPSELASVLGKTASRSSPPPPATQDDADEDDVIAAYQRARRLRTLSVGLFVAAAAVVVVGLGGLIFVATSGASESTLGAIERANAREVVLLRAASACAGQAGARVGEAPEYMGSVAEVGKLTKRIERQQEILSERIDALHEVGGLKDAWFVSAAEDNHGRTVARAVIDQPPMDCSEDLERLKQILSYETEAGSWSARMDTLGEAVKARGERTSWLAGHRAVVRRWPALAAPVEEMRSELRKARDAFAEVQAQGSEASGAYAIGEAVRSGEASLQTLVDLEQQQEKELDEVGETVDVILVDHRESSSVKLEEIRGKPGAPGPWPVTDRGWSDRPSSGVALARFVGMVVLHKGPGQLMRTADTHPTPPGWHYVGDRAHGSWSGPKPEDTWTFRPSSAWMKEVYWGGADAYVPVSRAEHQAYLQARKEEKVYVGTSGERPVYGTHGVWTEKRYPKAVAVTAATKARADLLYYKTYGRFPSSGGGYSSGGRSGFGSGGRGYGGFGK